MGKKSTSSTTTYTPTEQEKALQGLQLDFERYIMPNSYRLNDSAANMFFNSVGDTQVDYATLLQNAQNMTNNAQQGIAGLTTGAVNPVFQQNMENSIRSGVQNATGSLLTDLAGRGVINSSMAAQGIRDIENSVANTMAEQYSNNISTLNGLYGQQAALAGNMMTNAAAAQEAAQQPAINAWNMSLGLDQSNLGALSAMSGQGTTTSTQSQSGAGALGSLLGGVATGYAGNPKGVFCFIAGTSIFTSKGGVNIEDIEVGDEVYSVPNDSNYIELKEVIETIGPNEEECYRVTTQHGTGGESCVVTTKAQPFKTKDGEFVAVELLKINTELCGVGKVISIEYVGRQPVYDIKVAGDNNYMANGFIAKGAWE